MPFMPITAIWSKSNQSSVRLVWMLLWRAAPCFAVWAALFPPKDGEDWFRSGWKRKLMGLMILLLVKTPLGPLCVGHHAMNAVEEIRYLDRVFSELRAEGNQSMPAWDQLSQESLYLLRPAHHHHG